MSELEAALEFSVELSKFYNIDLFQRGFYQIRTSLKYPPKLPIKHEVSLPRNSNCDLVFPACILNGVAISKTFQILYRNEDITVDDMVLFKVNMLVDSQKIEECIEKADLQLCIELFFDEDYVPDQQERLQCVSQRMLKLHFTPTKGLHHHVPVVFDYFHLSTICVTVHGTLVMLQQPYINPKYPKDSWPNKTADKATLETVYFGMNKPVPGSTRRLQHARKMHMDICSILLSSYESLQASLDNFMTKLPPYQRLTLAHQDCHEKLQKVGKKIQAVAGEEDFVPTATSDIATLCAENMILWMQFTEAVTFNEKITKYLAQEHHTQRIKRFAEGFFTLENAKSRVTECFEPSIHGHADFAAIVKNSLYYQSIPPLAVECLEMDGDHTLLPVIFEDVFTDEVNVISLDVVDSRQRLSITKSDTSNPDSVSTHSSTSSAGDGVSPRLRHKQRKFIKNIKPGTFKRPGSTYALDEAESRNVPNGKSSHVSLIGYSKKSSVSSVQIGTLSPKIGRDPGLGTPGTFRKLNDDLPVALVTSGSDVACNAAKLSAAISVPSLNHEHLLKSVTTGSMPDLTNNITTKSTTQDVKKAWEMSIPDTRQERSSSVPSSLVENKLLTFEKTLPSITKQEVGQDFRQINGMTLDELVSSSSSCTDFDKTDSNDIVIEEMDNQDEDDSDVNASNGVLLLQKKDYDTLASSISRALGEPDEMSVKDFDDVKLTKGVTGLGAGIKNSISLTNGSQSGNVKIESTTSVSDVVISSGLGITESSGSKSHQVETVVKETSSRTSSTTSGSFCTANEFFKDEYKYLQKSKEMESKVVSSSSSQVSTCCEAHKTNVQNGGNHIPHGPSCPSLNVTGEMSLRAINGDVPVTRQPRSHLGLEYGLHTSSSLPELTSLEKKESLPKNRLVSVVADQTINFITAKELMKTQLHFHGHLYSDFMTQNSTTPYHWPPDKRLDDGLHLIICVHGLDGNSADLRLVRTYIEQCLPGERVDFLMSERNQPDTFADFETMTDRLVAEILYYLEMFSVKPAKVSFIGHSLGNLIIRSALSRPELSPLLPKMYTFLSLSGPHLGTLYNSSGLVNMGMWVMQKLKKSGSLLQLSLKDTTEPKQSFLYQLSQKPSLQYFKNVLLVGSSQDRYVPFHSSRIELCKAAVRDTTIYGNIYSEMVKNLLEPVLARPDITVVRYDVFHALPNTANSLIGRAAHIAVLDSEIFLEKFITVAALKYFK